MKQLITTLIALATLCGCTIKGRGGHTRVKSVFTCTEYTTDDRADPICPKLAEMTTKDGATMKQQGSSGSARPSPNV